MTSISRPGPLCELPLDRFLPSSSSSNLPSRPNKRPLSPGVSLFSPTKRRILTQEGFFSPEKSMKGTGISFGGDLSPAKKLEFPSSRIVTPVRARSLAPFPEPTKSTSCNDDDDFFSTPNRLSRPHPPLPHFSLVPRELPAPPDPQSVHYPGFVVHQDPHISVINAASLESLPQQEDKDEWKENIVPRRRIKKAITDPDNVKPTMMTPEAKKLELEKLFKAKSTPATPRKVASKEWQQQVTSPTPRRTGLRSGSKAGTPVISEEERIQRRRMLREEVETGGLDDEEL